MPSKLIEQFTKPAVVGAISYLGSMIVLPQNRFNVFSFNASSNVFYGLLGVGGSFVSEVAHQWILPLIPSNSKFAQTESMLLSPLVNAGLFAMGTNLFYQRNSILDTNQIDLIKPALLGGASEIGGQYLFEAVLQPYLGK